MAEEILGILVGGGPAPGINGVISAATIEARRRDIKVLGFYDGFKWLSQGELNFRELFIKDVSRIHTRGGSILRISREGNLRESGRLEKVLNTLIEAGVTRLLVIGGDGTAYSTYLLAQESRGKLSVVHVPKTIDNDLPLPGTTSTFGFQTARHKGAEIVQTIMEDSSTVGRWYFLVTMGRKSGHLALGIGKAAGATLTIIPEEFQDEKVSLAQLADILETSIYKRLAMGSDHGVALMAEGLLSILDEKELEKMGHLERDASGHIRFNELNLGDLLKEEVTRRLRERDLNIPIAVKNLGYELRCAPPISFDLEYSRTLGYGAVKHLLKGNTGTMICLQAQQIFSLPLENILDQEKKKIQIRQVSVNTEAYEVARKYMIRLEKKDLEEKEMFQKILEASKMKREEFLEHFSYMV